MTKKNKDQGTVGHKSEEALIAARRAKAQAVRELGQQPFSNRFHASKRTLLVEIRQRAQAARLPGTEDKYDPERVAELFGEETFHVMGRVMIRRGFGKASFLKLRDGSGELQLFAKQDELGTAFSVLETIDMADHVEASGPLLVTKTGELSLLVRSLHLVTKALRPLPDKWHGLADVEQRYRRRYVDTLANPEVAVVLRARSFIVAAVREFLDADGFLEVETPTLHTLVGGAAAQPFTTHHNALDLQLYLRIAPELYLKRLLVGGFERVYEIGRCYRNEGISTRHNPEFTMLEFYQAYATYETLMNTSEALLRHVDRALGERLTQSGWGDVYRSWVEARTFTLDEPFARVTMKDAITSALRRAELDSAAVMAQLPVVAKRASADTRQESEASEIVKGWATRGERSRRIDWGNFRRALGACDNEGERVFCAYEYLAEPFLVEDYRSADGSKSIPVFIIDFPAEVSPLARRKDANPALTDRFELFVDGIERCNAFSELNDPDDQAARFREQVAKKRRGAEETMDYDEDYIRALEHGMPPAAGFGMGIDRLVMMLTGRPSIRDVIAFPLLRPEATH